MTLRRVERRVCAASWLGDFRIGRIRSLAFIAAVVMTQAACGANSGKVCFSSEPGITTTALNLRQGPSTAWPVITVLPKGARIQVISHVGDWLQVSTGEQAGYVAGRYIRPVAVGDPCARVSGTGQVEKFLPAHRKILEETGWFEYVDSNIDAVEYFNYPAFDHPAGPAVGIAAFENGKRIAQIALKDWTDEQVVSVLVHEAGHLSGISQIGDTHSEEVATAIEERFIRDLHAMSSRVLSANNR